MAGTDLHGSYLETNGDIVLDSYLEISKTEYEESDSGAKYFAFASALVPTASFTSCIIASTSDPAFLALAPIFYGGNALLFWFMLMKNKATSSTLVSGDVLANLKFEKVGGSGYLKSLATKGPLVSHVELAVLPDGDFYVRSYRVKNMIPVMEAVIISKKEKEDIGMAWDLALESAKELSAS